MKSIVIYYSLDGNTKLLSETVAKEINAEVLPLNLKKKIKAGSFMKYFWGGRQVIMKESPELEPINFNADNYDLIIIGTPVWAGNYAPALKTFLSNNHIVGKRLALFCSHEGGSGETLSNLQSELSCNEVTSVIDFFAPLKKDEEVTLEKAKTWAKSLAK